MSRYRQFGNEFDPPATNSAAILPEIEIDEPFTLDFHPHLTDYVPQANRFRQCCVHRTRLERFLSCLTILLLTVLFIVIVVSLSYQKKIFIDAPCLSPACIEISHSISSAINLSANPCDDFYEFACGQWAQANVIPKGYPSWSKTRELARRNIILLKNILEQTPTASVTNIEREAIKYYQSCLNQTELERLDLQPLKDYFQNTLNYSLEQWIKLDQNQTYPQLFTQLARLFSTNYSYAFVLPIVVSADEKNSSWNNVYIDQPQLALGTRDYYLDAGTDTSHRLIRETYSRAGSDVLHLLGFDKEDASKRMKNILQFETELATISLSTEALQRHDQTYYLMTLKKLHDYYQAIGLDVVALFNDVFRVHSQTFTETDQVIVLNYQLIFNVSSILTDYLLTPGKSSTVIDHFLLSFVLASYSHLPARFEDAVAPLKKVLIGSDAVPERWEFCAKQTDQAFGFGVGSLFVKTFFGDADRAEAKDLIKTIRETFEDDLTNLQWIDEDSRSEAKRKLRKIEEKIGYPDWIFNQTTLNERYGGYTMIENQWFGNIVKATVRSRQRGLAKYRQKVDRSDWHMTPQTVNAYYSITVNEMVFPAGILQSPFFHKDFPIALNYGSIGSVIGHEMTHGFDNQGREFDADGNIRSWWSNISLSNFREKTQCFIAQYANFPVDGRNANGERTLGENIADNGGVKLAYYAYQKHTKHFLNSMNNRQLPGLNYSSDQLFFLAFAQSWCTIETPNSRQHSLVTDVHSLARLRVLGTVQNSAEFAKAFSCSANQKMNPSTKCQLW